MNSCKEVKINDLSIQIYQDLIPGKEDPEYYEGLVAKTTTPDNHVIKLTSEKSSGNDEYPFFVIREFQDGQEIGMESGILNYQRGIEGIVLMATDEKNEEGRIPFKIIEIPLFGIKFEEYIGDQEACLSTGFNQIIKNDNGYFDPQLNLITWMIFDHANSGIDITSPAYVNGIKGALLDLINDCGAKLRDKSFHDVLMKFE